MDNNTQNPKGTGELIEGFVAALNALYAEQNIELGKATPSMADYYQPVVVQFGHRFARIVVGPRGNMGAYAFVSLSEGNSKALGSWQAGEVFKPAGWSGPAKHARGTLADLQTLEALKAAGFTPYGAPYLK